MCVRVCDCVPFVFRHHHHLLHVFFFASVIESNKNINCIISVLVVSIGTVFAAPVPVPVSAPDVNPPVGCDNNGTDKQQSKVCQSPNDIACFYQVNDPRRNGAINTKIQSEPYQTYYQLRCSRAAKFDSLYTLAENQSSDECKNAINFSDLS